MYSSLGHMTEDVTIIHFSSCYHSIRVLKHSFIVLGCFFFQEIKRLIHRKPKAKYSENCHGSILRCK